MASSTRSHPSTLALQRRSTGLPLAPHYLPSLPRPLDAPPAIEHIWRPRSFNALAVAQSKGGHADGSTTLALAFDSGTASSGSLIVVAFSIYRPGGHSIAVNDNKGNTYVEVTGASISGASVVTSIWYCENASGGSGHTVTITDNSGAEFHGAALEITGALTSGALDKANAQDDASDTTPHTGSTGTLTQADEIVVIVTGNYTNGTGLSGIAVDGGWTQVSEHLNPTFQPGEVDYQIVSATTALEGGWTISGVTASWVSAIASFKAASGGGGGSSIAAIEHAYRQRRVA